MTDSLPPETVARIRPTPLIDAPQKPAPEKDNLSRALESTFTQPLQVGNLTLRPFSLGTLSLCRTLNLDMITGDRAAEELDDNEKQMQIVAFLFIQSQPLDQVLKASRDP